VKPPSSAAEQDAVNRMIQLGDTHAVQTLGRIERNR
jgi:hypothetical protein